MKNPAPRSLLGRAGQSESQERAFERRQQQTLRSEQRLASTIAFSPKSWGCHSINTHKKVCKIRSHYVAPHIGAAHSSLSLGCSAKLCWLNCCFSEETSAQTVCLLIDFIQHLPHLDEAMRLRCCFPISRGHVQNLPHCSLLPVSHSYKCKCPLGFLQDRRYKGNSHRCYRGLSFEFWSRVCQRCL